MKYTLGYQLRRSGFVVLLLIVLTIVAGQVALSYLKATSNNLVEEYNELAAMEEFKFSLGNLLISASGYAIYGHKHDDVYFNTLIHQAREKLKVCGEVLTDRHDRLFFEDYEGIINTVETKGKQMYLLSYPEDSDSISEIVKEIGDEIDRGIIRVDDILTETKLEIEEFVIINNTVIRHSTVTIIILGLISALVILFGGWIFIRNITRPIGELVSTTNKIGSGDRNAKVEINTHDEFHTLAESFNKMMDALEETTVSKNYLDDILKNMFDALIVTDNRLRIRSVNQAAANLLDYKKEQLTGQKLYVLFKNNESLKNFSELDNKNAEKLKSKLNEQQIMKTKTGRKVPMLISCAILKSQGGLAEGLIIVGHDQTKNKAIEEKLERTRRERLVEINEAQEEERMRIATDLHDGLGQMLTAISYAVQELSVNEQNDTIVINEPVNMIQQQIDKAIREAKNIAHNLIPIVLKDFGLIVAIENLINRANELYETKFTLDAFDFNVRIDPKREKVLYRICQESLNNIIKHANAKNAYYQIYWQDCCVVLVIEDDGVGFDTNATESDLKKSGIGLVSMKERVLSFDGNFTISSEPGNGTEIIVEIPCDKYFENENS